MKSNIVDHFPPHSSVHCGRNDPLYWLLVRSLQNPSQFPQFSTLKTSADPSGSPKGEAFCTDFEFADDVKLPRCPRCTTLSLDLWGRGIGARSPYQLCRRASIHVCVQGGPPLGPFAIKSISWGHVERLPSRRLFCDRGSHSPIDACKERMNIYEHTSHSEHEKRCKTRRGYRATNAIYPKTGIHKVVRSARIT